LNIRELAKIANVSPTTVSKVLNHKANDISEETKKRVWEVARQYNYAPYQNVINNLDLDGKLIGIFVPAIDALHLQVIRGAEKAAYEKGYEVVVCNIGDNPVMLENRLNSLRRKKAEGVIISRFATYGDEILSALTNYPTRVLDSYGSCTSAVNQVFRRLVNHGHKRIGLLTSDLKRTDTQKKLDACKNAFLKENLSFDISLVYETDSSPDSSVLGMRYLLSNKITAVIAFDDIIASGVYRLLQNEALRIPQDISVLCFGDYDIHPYLYPEPAIITTAYEEIGYNAVMDLVREIEGSVGGDTAVEAVVSWGIGIGRYHEQKDSFKRKVLVMGYLNMDTVIYIPHEIEESRCPNINASDVQIMAGGKASIQSAAVAKLGGNCYVVGRVGNDLNGGKIQNELSKMNINTGGILYDDTKPTGKATIYVPKEGKTSYDTDYGANLNFSPADIEQYEDLFSDAAYCLVSMQLPQEAFYHAARVCKRKNVKLICNAGPVFELDDYSYLGAHILIATLSGINILVPGKGSTEEKIRKLLKSHTENMIITQEYEGQCILINANQRTRFAMEDFEFVSHTAGVDCFCGALTVALISGKDLEESVAYALTGAALTMSRPGSLPALPDSEEIMENIGRVIHEAY